jgi:hypothetical protein
MKSGGRHGAGSVYQRRSDGRWFAVVEAGRSYRGTRLRRTISAATRGEVLNRLDQLRPPDRSEDTQVDRLRLQLKEAVAALQALQEQLTAIETASGEARPPVDPRGLPRGALQPPGNPRCPPSRSYG